MADLGKNAKITTEEIKKFFGVSITMLYLKFPTIRMYWARKTRINVIEDNFARDRYFLIRHNIKVLDDHVAP